MRAQQGLKVDPIGQVNALNVLQALGRDARLWLTRDRPELVRSPTEEAELWCPEALKTTTRKEQAGP